MRALTLTGIGGLEHLEVRNLPAPALRAEDDVLVRVRCAALNRIDLWMTGGLPNAKPVFPHVVGSDGAGEVEAVGPAVRGWRPGDRVLINPGISCGHCPACESGEESVCSRFGILGEHLPGTAAELVVVPAANLGRVPQGMSWSEAAAFPLATLTVWHMLTTRAKLQAGETVLIWGVGGGVGMAA
ncbi:MAG TPA: alcohol dehydrogenase catalytic domain-containing protein, partial [Gemmatimonadales bacterium]|nr:alcohol dehydrogenase catalytic domain-containing protein [Gemmatimonadales bacterium]